MICCNVAKIFPIMLALCLMLSVTYYTKNYAGIIGWFLNVTQLNTFYAINNQQQLQSEISRQWFSSESL